MEDRPVLPILAISSLQTGREAVSGTAFLCPLYLLRWIEMPQIRILYIARQLFGSNYLHPTDRYQCEVFPVQRIGSGSKHQRDGDRLPAKSPRLERLQSNHTSNIFNSKQYFEN